MGKGQQLNQSLTRISDVTGAVTGGASRGFAVGTNYVQKDQVAVVHKGEAIIPEGEPVQS